jgi:hypothetical protein
MMLSFNILAMLPYVWNGLVQIDMAAKSVPQVRDYDTCQWIAKMRTESPNGLDFTRVKRQTIRALTSDHWLKLVDNPGRYKLDLYWKNQYAPERRRLATVPCKGAHLITIMHEFNKPRTVQTMADNAPPASIMEYLPHHDGFETEAAFWDYFVPHPGDIKPCVLIRW